MARSCARVIIPLLALAFLGAAGCSKPAPAPAPAPPPAPAKPAAAAPKPAAASTVKVVEWSYSPGAMRDPFVALVKARKEVVRDLTKLPPLQRYDLASLKLSAIMIMGRKAAAQVVAPDKKAYTLRVGTLVGPNGGKVRSIGSDKVVIVTEYEDFSGRKVQQQEELLLHKKEGEI